MNGLVYYLSHVTLQAITDGTSNTFMVGERAHGKFPMSDVNCWNWWTSGNYGDTMFCTLYGINVFNKPPFKYARSASQAHRLVSARAPGPRRVCLVARQLPPRWCQRRLCRRIGQIHQGLDQQLEHQSLNDRQPRSSLLCLPADRGIGGSPDPLTYVIPLGTSVGVLQQLSTRQRRSRELRSVLRTRARFGSLMLSGERTKATRPWFSFCLPGSGQSLRQGSRRRRTERDWAAPMGGDSGSDHSYDPFCGIGWHVNRPEAPTGPSRSSRVRHGRGSRSGCSRWRARVLCHHHRSAEPHVHDEPALRLAGPTRQPAACSRSRLDCRDRDNAVAPPRRMAMFRG